MTRIPKKILVPIDFSAASDRALSAAKGIADEFDAEIHLLHVRTVVDESTVDAETLDEIRQILEASESDTRRNLERVGEIGGTRVHVHIKRGGVPADAIVDAVSEYGCDLLMMGTHGRRGLKRLFLGSVAREVIHRSPVPVVTTRADAKGIPTPQKILVAYDYSEYALQGIRMAAEWARRLSANVTLIHVVEQAVYSEFYFDHAPRDDYLELSIQWIHEHLNLIARKHLSGVPHETAVIQASVAKGITDFALINDFDLLVLATRGLSGVAHGLFGSVAARVTQLAEVPVLTVRAQPPIATEDPGRKPHE